ncbi:MAG: anhydro-N-acetylmuramic acid kinase [Streptosporangiales bacterium]|nr:anhydro-N-acetylmuramic acid kinase [Streptosporangiales bacterium]
MRVLGVMSGTSYDAVELAAADFRIEGETVRATPLGTLTVDFPDELRSRLAGVLPPARTTLAEICQLDTELGQLFGAAAERGVDQLTAGNADLVVSHGQTVYHWVEGRQARGTLQLGAPAWIAAATGCAVVSDLRTRDITRGGQGAPLVSLFDELLLLHDGAPRGSLNLGGIANVTVRTNGELLAWDIGPANALIDTTVGRLSGGTESMDLDGARAARGHVHDDLLADLLAEPYYELAPPKSTGKELFHTEYVAEHVARLEQRSGAGVDGDDLVATLTELTATLAGRTCHDHQLAELVIAGGGTHNPTLLARMRAHCAPASLVPVDTYGIPATGKEAYAFALLGFLSVHGIAGTVPSATGAREPSVLGSLTPGNEPLRLPTPATARPTRLVVDGR